MRRPGRRLEFAWRQHRSGPARAPIGTPLASGAVSSGATQVAEVIVLLVVAGVALTSLARQFGLPEPVLLVAGGVALAFVPGMPSIALEPEFWAVLDMRARSEGASLAGLIGLAEGQSIAWPDREGHVRLLRVLKVRRT